MTTAVREDGGDSPCYAGMVKTEADRWKKESRTEVAPEMELLCCVARTRPDASQARVRELLRSGLDQARLLRLAESHGMLPLLWRQVSSPGPALLSPALSHQLRERYQQHAIRSHYLFGELLHLVRLLATHGIPALPYKGPALAVMAYGSVEARWFVDLDILIRPADYARARTLLLAEGYCPAAPLSAAAERAMLREAHHLSLVRRQDGSNVELHWCIAPRWFRFPFAEMRLWENCETVALGGTQVLRPRFEDTLLMLCVHGTKHVWSKLSWVCDIAELIRQAEPGMLERALARASQLHSERMLLLGLWLAHTLLDAPLPAAIEQRASQDAAMLALAAQVCVRLRRGDGEPQSSFERLRFCLRARERWSDRVQSLVLHLLTADVGRWQRLPVLARLPLVNHLIRLVVLAKVYLTAASPVNSGAASKSEKHKRLPVSALRLCWRKPREAWLLARMAAWVVALSGLLKVRSLSGALKLVAPRKFRAKRRAEPEQLAALLDRLLRLNVFVWTPVCWKRAIILHRYLALNGLKTRVVFGVRRESDNLLTGHAWLEADGMPVLEARLPDYIVTWAFPSDPEH